MSFNYLNLIYKSYLFDVTNYTALIQLIIHANVNFFSFF